MSGGALGLAIAWWTARINSSVHAGSDGAVFGAWLALVYAVPLGLAGLAAALVLGRGAQRAVGSVCACVLVGFAAFVAADWALERVWWWPADHPLRALAACACGFAAMLAAARLVRPLLPRIGRVLPAACAVVALAAFASLAIPERMGVNATEGVPPANVKHRVILLGIDGADWRRIDPLIAQGRLPNFRRLIEGGVRADLKTLQPTWSPIIWNTIATGATEDRHGVHDFTEVIVPGMERGLQRTYVKFSEPAMLPPSTGLLPLVRALVRGGVLPELPISSRHRRVKAVWNMLSDRGLTVAVVGWFASFPSEIVRGFVVSDNDPWHQLENEQKFGAKGPRGIGLTYPSTLLGELVEGLPPIPADEQLPAHQARTGGIYRDLTAQERAKTDEFEDIPAMAASVQGGDRFSAEAGLHIWRQKQPQFMAVYLRAVDNLSHRLRQYTGVVDRTYEWTDALLGEYLDALDADTTLIVASDHGWGYEPEKAVGHNHGPDGILALYGAGVRRGAQWEHQPSVLDLAPTVLAIFGLPAAQDMLGRPLAECFDPPFAPLPRIATWGEYNAQWPPESAGEGARELQEAGAKRLRALGYAE